MLKKSSIKLISYSLLAAAFFIGFFNRFSPATFASPISDSLGVSIAAIGSLAALHFWVYTLMQVPAGIIVDRYGIRTPAAIGTLLSGLGALILGSSEEYWVALIGPCFVGLGMSLVFVAVMKNNAIWFDGEKFGFITGVTLLIGTFGAVASESPALFILKYTSWRQIFIYLGLITLAISILIALLWRHPNEALSDKKTLNNSKVANKFDAKAWLNVIRYRQLWLILLAISGTNGTFYAFAGLWGIPFLNEGVTLSNATSSLIITLSLLIYGLASLFFGRISDLLERRKIFIWSAAFVNTLCWIWMMFFPESGLLSALTCFLLAGLSSGVQVVASFAAIKESVNDNIAGSAIAFVNMGVFLTTAIVQAGYGWIIVSLSSTSNPTLSAYQIGLWLPAILSLIGLIASVFVKETYPKK